MTSEVLAIYACTVQVYADLWDFKMYSLQKLLYYFHFSKHNPVVQNLSFTCLRWKGNFLNKTFLNVFFFLGHLLAFSVGALASPHACFQHLMPSERESSGLLCAILCAYGKSAVFRNSILKPAAFVDLF